MKKQLLSLLLASGIISAFYFNSGNSFYQPRQKEIRSAGEEGIEGAIRQVYSRRLNQFTHEVDFNDVEKARQQADALAASRKKEALTLWWEELGPDNVGGRTRAFMIDKNNPNRMYAGSVSGGLWSSDDAGASWKKYNDLIENLAVASLCQAANGDVYFGTGEGLYGNWGTGSGGIQGQGIWKSTDGGANFYRLPATWDNATTSERGAFINVNRMAADPVNPNRIYAATKKGIRVTSDGGATWLNPVKLVNGQPNQNVSTDIDAASDGTVIASIGNRFHRSATGDTGSFVQLFNGLPTGGIGRYEFAIAPSDPKTMYCGAVDANGALVNIYQTKDKGDTWNVIGAGGGTFEPYGNTVGIYSYTQGTYDNALGVSPFNPNKLVVAGIQLWMWTDTDGWKYIAHHSDDLGSEDSTWVHADKHYVLFHPTDSNTFYITNDGGMFETKNNGKTYKRITYKYNTVQFYTIAAARNGEVMGGTQDNGTQYIDYKGATPQTAVRCYQADGGFTEISRIDTSAYFASKQLGGLVRSNAKGAMGTFLPFFDSHIAPDTSLVGWDYSFGHWMTPYILWEKMNGSTPVDTTFIVGLVGSVWVTKGAIDFSKTPKWYKVSGFSGTPQTMALTDDGNTLFVGTSNGTLLRIDGLSYVKDSLDTSGTNYNLTTLSTTITAKTIRISSQTVTGIAINQSNPNHLVVTYGNYGNTNFVYQSLNAMAATPTFTSIQKNLPLLPVYGVVIDRIDTTGNRIVLATEMGMYMSEDKGVTWSEQNFGMARVPVFMVRQQTVYTSRGLEPMLFIATHGRGLYRSSIATGIKEIAAKTPSVYSLEIFPNPAKENAVVSYQLQSSSEVEITIHDLSGKRVLYEIIPVQQAGKHQYSFNLERLSAGTYLVSVNSGTHTAAGKILVRK